MFIQHRKPKAGEAWITLGGDVVYFTRNIGGVLAGALTRKGFAIRKVKGTYYVDWAWYHKSGKFDHPANPPHPMDCAQFLTTIRT